jgi:hypothetical protein
MQGSCSIPWAHTLCVSRILSTLVQNSIPIAFCSALVQTCHSRLHHLVHKVICMLKKTFDMIARVSSNRPTRLTRSRGKVKAWSVLRIHKGRRGCCRWVWGSKRSRGKVCLGGLWGTQQCRGAQHILNSFRYLHSTSGLSRTRVFGVTFQAIRPHGSIAGIAGSWYRSIAGIVGSVGCLCVYRRLSRVPFRENGPSRSGLRAVIGDSQS